MAELPEIMILTSQMDEQLQAKEFQEGELRQEKSLNLPVDEFLEKIRGKKVVKVYNKGKWIFIQLSDEYHLLLNLGMGADILYHETDQELPDEYQCLFQFTDGSSFSCKFWWIGRAELLPDVELPQHKATKDIAISPLGEEFTPEYFRQLCSARSQIKNLILNQKKIGGIGNVYIHDILFRAKIHPQKVANTLESCKLDNLHRIIQENLENALERGGLFYERDFYGQKNGFTREDFLVAYKEGEPCPECGNTIEKIKTGSTSSYICPQCQKL
ncbi:MAG: formamidopyrimidine-DNA glycosylase [Methanobacterium sp.]|jgi:formamidopyrimidine-DNA glycosylase|uniref:Formamidopyrimidine-DNA glycosylase n=1 Tax=Methanobacterium subterraneum TaxID=59277 RepID=A0A2H4VRA2_9EURY|nr:MULTISPECIES: DNA-formamidopyrimidine glycosylase family protein [Methanobacterium]AUB57508.1 formamidopyrimidine-DNA glycosylase [Methanobacterium sp. MZ-A1]AUB60629.1 formamidopyrimidine-DNA glycosylase [Methanobacterium subterraneum]MBW4258425.1 Fpg/Nei family DNA glycosylase [Methanobacterium sp. YSL]MCC7561131.1 formamidopyrimidine-DNA glycosylase [Methanobacterium sp.]